MNLLQVSKNILPSELIQPIGSRKVEGNIQMQAS